MSKVVELSTAAKMFVEQLNQMPKLFNKTPKHIFQPSVNWPMFHEKVKKPFIIYVTRPGLTGLDFHIDRSEPLAMGFLHFLNSSNLHVGYVFEIDFAPMIEYNPHYLMVAKKLINWKQKITPEIPLTNQHITVYCYGEEMLLAIRKEFVFEIVKP